MAEQFLSQIEKNTRQFPQTATEIKFNTNFYRMPLNQSIDLSDGNYVMGVISFNTYNSIFNITSKNNKLFTITELWLWELTIYANKVMHSWSLWNYSNKPRNI